MRIYKIDNLNRYCVIESLIKNSLGFGSYGIQGGPRSATNEYQLFSKKFFLLSGKISHEIEMPINANSKPIYKKYDPLGNFILQKQGDTETHIKYNGKLKIQLDIFNNKKCQQRTLYSYCGSGQLVKKHIIQYIMPFKEDDSYEKYYYNQTGDLSLIVYGTSRAGNQLDITYEYQCDNCGRKISSKKIVKGRSAAGPPQVTLCKYDTKGQLIYKLNYDGTEIKYTYDDNTGKIKYKETNDSICVYTYDSAGRIKFQTKKQCLDTLQCPWELMSYRYKEYII